jgi:dihydroorotate dehydrogenase electron transfer subunit
MSEKSSAANRGVFSATVCANKQIGQRFYQLGLEFSGAGAEAFDKVDVSGRRILLRRPFSFCDITAKENKTLAEILYCVVGPATLRMTTLAAGDSISIIGPLGNGFWVPEGKKTALLVAGGMGAGPLENLAKILTADYSDIEVIAFAGAKTVKELPFEARLDEISQRLGFSLPEFAKYGIESQVATDDGSTGFAGLVTDCLSEWLSRSGLASKDIVIYGCGPEQMLARVAEIAKDKKIDCQVSMERRMACGIGLCQSCAVECRVAGSNETIYKLCCEDGPVFNSNELVFSA